MLSLGSNTGSERRLAQVLLRGDGSLAGLDSRVVGAGGGSTGLHGLGVGLKLGSNGGGALSDSLSNHDNLSELLGGEAEPVTDLSIEVLLGGESVRGVEERAGGGNNDTVLADLLDSGLNLLNGSLEVGLPDVTAVNDTSGQGLVGAKSGNNSVELLGVTDKIHVDGVDVLEGGEDINVVDDVTEVGSHSQAGSLGTQVTKNLVGGLESSLDLGSKVVDENGLINLNILGTSSLKLRQQVNVDGDKVVDLGDRVHASTTVGLGKGQERDGTQEDGAGSDTSSLGLVELADGLRVGGKSEDLVVRQSRLDVVVVAVEPLDHLQGGDIDASLLVTTTHGKVGVKGVEVVLAVTLGDDVEQLDVVKDLIVEGKVVGGDAVNTSSLLDLPVLQTQTLALGEEVITRDLATPVGFRGLLQVTETAHTGETQNGANKLVNS